MPLSITLGNITFDCDDTMLVATFWGTVFDQPVAPDSTEWFAKLNPWNGGPSYFFLKVPEGKTSKNRVHLDLSADNPREEVERLIQAGATKVAEKNEWGFAWTVLNDPEGNEFCVAGRHE